MGAGQPVHRLAPGPEVVGGVRLGRRPLGRAAQVALEGVRVGVDHRRDLVRPHASRSSAAQQRVRAGGGVLEVDLLLRRVADAGRRCARAPCPPGGARRRCPRRGRRSTRAPAGRRARRARRGRTRRPRCGRRWRARSRTPVRRRQRRRARRRARARHASSRSGSGVRPSIHRRTWAGTVVKAFGRTRMRAAVTRKSGSPPASSSAATISRAAAASASRRSSRRVVPAWSARPSSSTREPHARGERPDGAGRRAGPREVARLVDVELEEAAQPREPARRLAEALRVGAGRAHRVGERDAVVVRAGEHVGDVEPADERARAERRRVEARALLVGEGDHGDGRAQPARRPRSRQRRRARRRSARRGARCRGASRSPTTDPAPSGTAHSEPAGSRSTRRPAARACSANHASAAASSGVQASRVVPSSPRPDRLQAGQAVAQLGRVDHAAHPPRLVGAHVDERAARERPPPPGCARSGRGRAPRGRRAGARRRACRARASRARPNGRAPRPRSAWPRAAPRARSSRSGARPGR